MIDIGFNRREYGVHGISGTQDPGIAGMKTDYTIITRRRTFLSNSTMETTVVKTHEKGALTAYLACNAQTIDLPGLHPEDSSYPFCILDGASGVGKTQQAIALLLAGHSLSYVNMGRVSTNSQQIYRDMEEIAKEAGHSSYLTTIEKAMLFASEYNKVADWCSIDSIDLIKKETADEEGPFSALEECFNDLALSYTSSFYVPSELHHHSKNTDASKNVLFLDEALPRNQASSRNKPFTDYDTLRFVRNMGRILGWRVVVAGTGATAANMIAESSPFGAVSASRQGTEVIC